MRARDRMVTAALLEGTNSSAESINSILAQNTVNSSDLTSDRKITEKILVQFYLDQEVVHLMNHNKNCNWSFFINELVRYWLMLDEDS